jgi:hypothetical protein
MQEGYIMLKKYKKPTIILMALVMALSISSVAMAATFNTIEGDGVFTEYTENGATERRYEADVEATITQENMLLNLDIDYMRGVNPIIRQVSIDNANLELSGIVFNDLGDVFDLAPDEYIILLDNDGREYGVGALVRITIDTLEPQYYFVAIENNVDVGFARKDVILFMPSDGDITSAFILLAGKSTIQFNRQNAQGGQSQQ